ncbi:hypothetical protein [Ileibacterium valens]|uniref:hypothetical protein n=1 Tax=Ileibacterium valens TaxID=1862668 RepID=UPI002570BF9F|nr:hypothetical protein [Ileibacterium valens]
MKRTIRKNCFETNSSSMHCLVIGDEDNYEGSRWLHYVDDEGYFRIPERFSEDDCRFGRGFEIINDAESKALYLIAALSDNEDYRPWSDLQEENGIIQEVVEALREIKPDLKGVVPTIEIVAKGKHSKEYDVQTSAGKFDIKPYWGTVDHNSNGMLQAFFRRHWGNDISIKEFILNQKYVLVIDSDEDSGLVKLQDAGVLNNRKIFGSTMYSKKEYKDRWDRDFDFWEE